MFFARPVFLWLLLVLPVVIWWHRRRRLGAGPVRHVVLAALRIGAVGCAVLALARPILRVHERRAVHVDVVDVSSSLSDHDIEETARRVRERRREAAASGTDEYALVVFDARPRLVETPANGPTGEWLVAQRDASGVAGSRIADALRFAASLVGEGSVGHVVLYSDGLETGGDARAAALHLGQRGPTLTTEVVGARRDGALVLRAVDGPAGARIGETIEPTFRVGSSRAGSARLVVRDADTGEVVLSSTRAIRAGVQTITAPIELRRVGTLSFDATIEADWDSYTKNNERTFAVAVNPAMRVAVVEAGANAPAAAVLSEWLAPGSVVSSLTPRELAADTHALDGVNLLVLGDVPPDELPAPAMRAIDGAVERGLGLLVAGGRRAFGRGGYRDTELARIVPVDFSDTMERRDPSVTLVIVIDTSGSMTGPRMAIAQAVARLAMQRLQAHDKVGIVEFYGSKRWAARIQSAANAIDINRALNRLSAGGGTVILPAIEEAYYALLNVRTRLKHVLIVTDGGVETGPFQSVITRMADANITVTTVAAGTAQYSTFLSDLAHWGRGRFYAAPDRFHLPEIILKQPESVPSSPFVEEPSRIEPAVSLPMFEGIDFDRWPALEGYVRASTKPTGRTWLRSSLGDPVLASWRYGRGSVDVMTTDLGGAWSAALAGSPDWARLMSNVVRQTASPTSTEGFEIRPLRRGAGIELAIRYVGRDAIDPSTALELTIRDPEGTTTRRPVDPYLPGRWNALVAEPQRGVYRFSVRAPGIRASGHAAIAIDPPREVPAIAPDETLMGDLAKLAAEAPTEATHAAAVRYLDLWPWFTLAAIAALLAHVLIRRWPWWGRMPAVTALLVGAYIWGGDTSPAFALGVAETQTTRGVASASGNALEAARQALREGHIAQARSVLQTHVAAGEARAEAWSLLARCCELLGDNDAASDALGKALEMTADPDQRFVLAVRRIGLAFDSGNADAGRGRLQRLADETSDPARRLFCGRLAALWGESALAARLLAPGDAQSEDPRDWLIAGLVASRAGLADDAAASYERAARALRTRRDRAYAIDRLIDTAERRTPDAAGASAARVGAR
jgi:Ca-activated chloride channel family protein